MRSVLFVLFLPMYTLAPQNIVSTVASMNIATAVAWSSQKYALLLSKLYQTLITMCCLKRPKHCPQCGVTSFAFILNPSQFKSILSSQWTGEQTMTVHVCVRGMSLHPLLLLQHLGWAQWLADFNKLVIIFWKDIGWGNRQRDYLLEGVGYNCIYLYLVFWPVCILTNTAASSRQLVFLHLTTGLW